MAIRRQIKKRLNPNTLILEYFIDDGTKPYSKAGAEAELARLEEEERQIEKKSQTPPKQVPVDPPSEDANIVPLPEEKQSDDNPEEEDGNRRRGPRH
jgi:hypothetical protein